ncbi:hypothetical protein Ahy_B06g081695 [Arachis hypogaea]|uniref:Aminotransferase-like plant mobile domain-containing protein n=1 Tax=Arachis hypogaea TaxID=3818 RepID=A0A444YLR9_ARAHY|nr:hypothetical protein Ahy_B06g081695 [Arachis hypogaea]
MGDDPVRLYHLDGVAHIAGVINDEVISLSDAFRACGGSRACDSMRGWPSSLGLVPGVASADEETVRRYARAYIIMLLRTQLFADKSSNRIHIRWLPYVARLEEMGSYG